VIARGLDETVRGMRLGGEVRRWLAAAILMASAALTGWGLGAGLCDLGRRLQSRAAEAPADASFQLTISLAALMWLVLWVLFARSQRWKRFGRLLSAAPFALFCLAAWRSAAIACSAF
jgi:hypothetical protein